MVKRTNPIVSWDKAAFASLQKIFQYISRDSIINAEKVRDSILKITRGLPNDPFRYPPDKFKSNNKGNYRAFEKYSYRVAYKITATDQDSPNSTHKARTLGILS